MNERGLFGVPMSQNDYTGKYCVGDFVKFYASGYELFGKIIDVHGSKREHATDFEVKPRKSARRWNSTTIESY